MVAGTLVFVSGQDPEEGGRLVYRGRVGRELAARQARAALRLATLNALAAAQGALGSLGGIRRCVALTAFVDAVEGAFAPGLPRDALALIARAFPAAPPPVVWLRPVRGLAGGMPVEVELILETVATGRGVGSFTAAAGTRPLGRQVGRARVP